MHVYIHIYLFVDPDHAIQGEGQALNKVPFVDYLVFFLFFFSSFQTYRDSRGVWCTALLSSGKTHSSNPDARVTYLESGQGVR